MNFDFKNVQTEVNETNYLAPFGIYDVKFMGTEDRTFQSTKEPDKNYRVLDIKFAGKEGEYTYSLFYPVEGDEDRRIIPTTKGTNKEMPSRWEETKMFIAQLLQTLSPAGWARLQKGSVNIKTPEQLFQVLATLLDAVKGKETHLKLIGRQRNGVWEAQIPSFCAVSTRDHDHPVYMSERFIGDNLKFSNWETQKMNEYKAGPKEETGVPTSQNNLDSIYGSAPAAPTAPEAQPVPAEQAAPAPGHKVMAGGPATPTAAPTQKQAGVQVGTPSKSDDISSILGVA